MYGRYDVIVECIADIYNVIVECMAGSGAHVESINSI